MHYANWAVVAERSLFTGDLSKLNDLCVVIVEEGCIRRKMFGE